MIRWLVHGHHLGRGHGVVGDHAPVQGQVLHWYIFRLRTGKVITVLGREVTGRGEVATHSIAALHDVVVRLVRRHRRHASSLHGAVLVPRATLAGHRPIERRVAVRLVIAGGRCNGLRYKVLLLPPGLAVHLAQLLVHPHGVEHLAGELDNPRGEPAPLSRYRHQSLNATGLEEGPEADKQTVLQ